ncbi:hypothetical protein [Nonomuraea sp. NPDC023979]|uniref:Mom family adenine methylcarbamoylation protein n=1 Tax=Nonomuraea sp. NPDC023979 TaxID=3154796 RepID=UPI0033C727D5
MATILTEVNPANDWCQRCGPGRTHTWVHRRDGGFDPDQYTVEAVAEPTAKAFVMAHHYSGAYVADILRYGLFDLAATGPGGGPALVGMMVLSTPQNVLAITNPFPELEPFKESAELGRFVLLDGVPSNAETNFLRRGFELAREEGMRGVVSFADPMPRATVDGRLVMPGHIGAIYREKGALYAGRSTPGPLWLAPDGTSLSERSLQKIRRNEQGHEGVERRLVAYGASPREPHEDDGAAWLRRELQRIGVRRVRHRGKHRYLFKLAKTRAQRRQIHIAMPTSRTYPTRVDVPPAPGANLPAATH